MEILEALRPTLEDICPETKEDLFWDIRDESLYDFKIASPDGSDPDILSKYEGKVTLVFNCSAGCGNVPQHSVLRQLDERYADQPDFNIQAVVVDDFTCHGYEEFNDGLVAYAEKNELELTPGEVAENYARKNFGSEYAFSELTNGRFDKHNYDPDWVPGAQYEQEPHPFWLNITGGKDLPRDEQNLPHHYEESPWAAIPQVEDRSKPGFSPLKGNFEKFLIDRTGKRFHRYFNGFLLGQRGRHGAEFPWWADENDYAHLQEIFDKRKDGLWPSEMQRMGIDFSLDLISRDIDSLL